MPGVPVGDAGSPLATSRAAFLGAAPVPLLGLALGAALGRVHAEPRGLVLATVSGAVASALGYIAWYAALPRLTATRAATLQLAVPVIALAGAVLLLGEQPNARAMAASALVLVGIGISLRAPGGARAKQPGTSV